jgi:hypothetical protein
MAQPRNYDYTSLDKPSVIYRENTEEIESYLQQSLIYRLNGTTARLTYYGILFAIVNALFAPFTATNTQASLIGSAILALTFLLFHLTSRYFLKQQRYAAAKQIGYSWDTNLPRIRQSR